MLSTSSSLLKLGHGVMLRKEPTLAGRAVFSLHPRQVRVLSAQDLACGPQVPMFASPLTGISGGRPAGTPQCLSPSHEGMAMGLQLAELLRVGDPCVDAAERCLVLRRRRRWGGEATTPKGLLSMYVGMNLSTYTYTYP